MRRVAYQGCPGAFGHQACLQFLADYTPLACGSFAEVVAAVEAGKAERGLLPLENNRAGPVEEVRDLLAGCDLAILARHWLAVRMHLLALPGTALGDVTAIVSHPVALAQCADHVRALGVATRPTTNTALAAQALRDPAEAVLASEAAAQAYGLAILRRDMQDRPDNATCFVELARAG